MYGKNTLDKIYLTQKKLLPPSLYLPKGENSHPSPILLPPKGGTLHPFKGKLLYPLKLKGELQFTPTDPCSLTPVHCFMLKISCNTKKIVPLHQIILWGSTGFDSKPKHKVSTPSYEANAR